MPSATSPRQQCVREEATHLSTFGPQPWRSLLALLEFPSEPRTHRRQKLPVWAAREEFLKLMAANQALPPLAAAQLGRHRGQSHRKFHQNPLLLLGLVGQVVALVGETGSGKTTQFEPQSLQCQEVCFPCPCRVVIRHRTADSSPWDSRGEGTTVQLCEFRLPQILLDAGQPPQRRASQLEILKRVATRQDTMCRMAKSNRWPVHSLALSAVLVDVEQQQQGLPSLPWAAPV